MFEGFQSRSVAVEGTHIFLKLGGSGTPLLLLHGFPETHIMWRDIASKLARRFCVVCADLPGYGASGCPTSAADHAPYSKRRAAAGMVAAMAQLGFARFAVAGHDRGGRVAYRMALDHPDRVTRLAVLDIVPTAEAWERADARLTLAFWPWSLLAQPAPLPEKLLAAAPEAVIGNAAEGWGSASDAFPPDVRAAYLEALRDPEHIHAICEEYRAAATIDWRHDREDRERNRKIRQPLHALWSAEGGLAEWYDETGGPLSLWRRWADDVSGKAMPGGHFFPEEHPGETAEALAAFFGPEP